MKLYEIVNEWYVDEYTFEEPKSIWMSEELAEIELFGIAHNLGVELPHDQKNFYHEDDFYYIRERETSD